jgi:hypothetical protein
VPADDLDIVREYNRAAQSPTGDRAAMKTRDAVRIFALALAVVSVRPVLATAGEFAESTAADRGAVSVTVYNVDLALVRETRTLDIDRAGEGTMRFMDVPSAINPRTVHLKALAGAGISVLEQNYEYDLISPDKLMEKYVGKELEIVEQAEDLTTRSTKAVLLATSNGPVYRVGDRIVLGQPGRVVLPDLPEDLVARPTLVWTLAAAKAGKHDVEASYLTDGMTWSADYVAVANAADTKIDLTGWVTVENRSGAAYQNATLKLVAGDVRRVTPREDMRYRKAMREEAIAAAAAPDQFREEQFFEYHLYTLERPTTLKENQTKQISLFQASGVPVEKKLVLRGEPYYFRSEGGTLTQNEKVKVYLELTNDEASGLGMPLPKGTVRVYKKDESGAEQFAGEDSIDHTPKDERVRLFVGEAFDVVADRTQTEWRMLSPRESESAYKLSIRNRKNEDVTVTVREPVGGDWKLLESSVEGKKLDAGTLEFSVPVPKGKEAVLTYRIGVRW